MMMMMVGVFIKYEGRWLVVAPKKVTTDRTNKGAWEPKNHEGAGRAPAFYCAIYIGILGSDTEILYTYAGRRHCIQYIFSLLLLPPSSSSSSDNKQRGQGRRRRSVVGSVFFFCRVLMMMMMVGGLY